ncbi:hypothetical protein FB451DRAFT_1551130, partial [Mycena latifolia]
GLLHRRVFHQHHRQGRGHRPPARERRRRHGLERELRRVQGGYVPPRVHHPQPRQYQLAGNHIIRRHIHPPTTFAPRLRSYLGRPIILLLSNSSSFAHLFRCNSSLQPDTVV